MNFNDLILIRLERSQRFDSVAGFKGWKIPLRGRSGGWSQGLSTLTGSICQANCFTNLFKSSKNFISRTVFCWKSEIPHLLVTGM